MAGWVHRAERLPESGESFFNGGGLRSTPGPGAYDTRGQRMVGSRPVRSAFGGGVRGGGWDSFGTSPGPGAYDVNSNARTSVSASSNVCFGSSRGKVSSLAKEALESTGKPGPGQYYGNIFEQSAFQARKSVRRTLSKNEHGLSLTQPRYNPPAIPYREQTQGYEEDLLSGEVLPTWTTSPRACTVGPGDYSPRPMAGSGGKGCVNFSHGSERKTMFVTTKEAAECPGPGDYETITTPKYSVSEALPSASFRSKVGRLLLATGGHGRQNDPGPGDYSPKWGGGSPPTHAAAAAFGSSSQKISVVEEVALCSKERPGPGEYENGHSGFDYRPRPMLTKDAPPAFNVSDKRPCMVPNKTHDGPGPGDYYQTLQQPADRKSSGACFGSTGERWHKELQQKEATNPMDIWNIAAGAPARRRVRLHRPKGASWAAATLRSTCQSTLLREAGTSPSLKILQRNASRKAATAPSLNECKNNISRRQKQEKSSGGHFLSGAPRSLHIEQPAGPGPGEYGWRDTNHHHSSRKGTLPRSSRFCGSSLQSLSSAGAGAGACPGPGTYNIPSSLVRPSHNVTLMNDRTTTSTTFSSCAGEWAPQDEHSNLCLYAIPPKKR
jgi:hypothetical protein